MIFHRFRLNFRGGQGWTNPFFPVLVKVDWLGVKIEGTLKVSQTRVILFPLLSSVPISSVTQAPDECPHDANCLTTVLTAFHLLPHAL
jgi:hypothetical protein